MRFYHASSHAYGYGPAVAETEQQKRTRRARIAARVRHEIAAISPERTRAASWVERMTVQRLSWSQVVKLNRILEVLGRLTTVVYCIFIVTLVLGVDWKHGVQETFNAGEPVKGVLAFVLVVPTLIFVALHSITGYGRWRLQRELWRRDVQSMAEGMGEVAEEASEPVRP
jgi:hypothetical protein